MDIKRFTKNKMRHLAAVFFIGLFLFAYHSANAATLQIVASPTSIAVGETAVLQVTLDSTGVAINNTEAKITFPADMLDVISISKSYSVFSIWVEEPSFSNVTGMINLDGGVPTPGFSGSRGNVVNITVRAKKAGQAQVSISDAAVRANDGMGTDVLEIGRASCRERVCQ